MPSRKPAWPQSYRSTRPGRRGVRQVLRIAGRTRCTKKPEPLRERTSSHRHYVTPWTHLNRVPLCLKLLCPLVHTSYSRYSSNIAFIPRMFYRKREIAGASLPLRVFNRHLFYAIQLQVLRRLLTMALKHSYILGRELSAPEKEDPEHYPNDHQNHQKG
jgi:hypothetical protein